MTDSLDRFMQISDEIFWEYDHKTNTIIYISSACTQILGQTPDKLIQDKEAWLKLTHPDYYNIVIEYFIHELKSDKFSNCGIKYKIIRPDKAIRDLYSRGYQQHDSKGNLISIYGITRDITEYHLQRSMIKLMFSSNEIFKKNVGQIESYVQLLKLVCDLFAWEVGEVWIVRSQNDELQLLAQWRYHHTQISLPDKLEVNKQFITEAYQTNLSQWISYQSYDNQVVYKTAVIIPIMYKNERIGIINFYTKEHQTKNDNIIKSLEVISSRLGEYFKYQSITDEITFVSDHDKLTGLINRKAFEKQLSDLIQESRRNKLVIMSLDIDKLNVINDILGFVIGDKVIRTIAKKLKQMLPSNKDILASLGVDNFIFVLQGNWPNDKIKNFALSLIKLVNEPFMIDNSKISITVSIGICIYPDDGYESATLLRNSNAAMMRVKNSGGDYYEFFKTTEQFAIVERYSVINDMKTALDSKQFIVYYQPKVDLKSNKIVGAEALIRWQHPDKGLLYPSSFLNLAENTGLIIPISEYILNLIFKSIATGELTLPIAINLSIVQFKKQYNFVEYVERLMTEFNIQGHNIEFEVTENLMMMAEKEAIKILNKLRNLGIEISYDDFGTGYSSFMYLTSFMPSTIKIDKYFIDDMIFNQRNRIIVRAIITLSHSLKAKVIAEGVSTIEQVNILREEGCDQIQGYYISEPLSLHGLISFTKNYNKLS